MHSIGMNVNSSFLFNEFIKNFNHNESEIIISRHYIVVIWKISDDLLLKMIIHT